MSAQTDVLALWRHWPVANAWQRITALFGGNNKDLWPWWDGRHNGIDFSAKPGEPVFAVRDGRVFEVRYDANGYGNYLKLGDNASHLLYAHFSQVVVKDGDFVRAGDVLGYAGATGNATGVHVHIGMRIPEQPRRGDEMDGWINPLPWVWELLLRPHNFKLSDHWVPYHRGEYDLEVLRRWAPPVMKLLDRGYSDPDVMRLVVEVAESAGSIIVLRNHPLSEQHNDLFRDPVGFGEHVARDWVKTLEDIEKNIGRTLPRHLIGVEGVNEPPEWWFGLAGPEQRHGADVIARSHAAFAQECIRHNLIPVGPNLSVGWPGNGGVAEKPPHWHAYEAMRQPFLRAGGIVATHEYALGAKDWQGARWDMELGWRIGRYARRYDQSPPWTGTFSIITETGIDNGKVGWRGLGFTEQEYMEFLKELDGVYMQDPFVLGACVFSRDGAKDPWWQFYIQMPQLMELLVAYADERRALYDADAIFGAADDGGGADGAGDAGGDVGGDSGGAAGGPGGAENGENEDGDMRMWMEALEERVAALEAWAGAFGED